MSNQIETWRMFSLLFLSIIILIIGGFGSLTSDLIIFRYIFCIGIGLWMAFGITVTDWKSSKK